MGEIDARDGLMAMNVAMMGWMATESFLRRKQWHDFINRKWGYFQLALMYCIGSLRDAGMWSEDKDRQLAELARLNNVDS